MTTELDKRERDLPEISYLIGLDGEVREDGEIVRPEASNPSVVPIGAALELQIERDELDPLIR
jgi:hypothetical protein